MKNYDNVGRMRRAILRQLRIEHDMLPPGIQSRVDGAINRTRRIVQRLDSGLQARHPAGRMHAKRVLVGGTGTIVDYIDGATGGKKRSKPVKRQSKKRRRVVGK